jgi:predicted nicotinamide N-methyase
MTIKEVNSSALLPTSNDANDGSKTSSSSDSNHPSLPKRAHPTARAFFDALDYHQNEKQHSPQRQQHHHHYQEQQQQRCSRISNPSLRKTLQSVGWRNRHSQDQYYPIQILNQNFTVQQIQRGEIEGTYGTGATVWPAALVLIKYLERHASTLVKGRHVIDLGSGTGVTSIAAAVLGAALVVCTDGEVSLVPLECHNIQRAAKELKGQQPRPSQLELEVETSSAVVQHAQNDSHDAAATAVVVATIANCPMIVQKYWWGTDEVPQKPNSMKAVCGYDLILVADCVLPKLYPMAPLVQAIDECLMTSMTEENQPPHSSCPCALLSYEHRYYPDYDPRDKFQELATARNLHVYVVPMDDMDPIYSVDDIELWIVTREAYR